MKRPSTIFSCKSVAFVILFLLLAFAARSQNYAFSASSGTFTPNSAGIAVDGVDDDDAISGLLPIGFTFNYFGTGYTQFKISSNGFITFSGTAQDLFFNTIEDNNDLLVAPLWDDLDGTGATVSYQLTGSSPNQILTIEWLNYQWNYQASAAGISFQVKLYETSNVIEFHYKQEAGAVNSPSASIGLTNSTGGFYSLNNATSSAELNPSGANNINTKPATGQIFRFTPSAAPTTPATQASGVTISQNTSGNSLAFNWTNGNGSYRAVFMKQTALAGDVPTIEDGTSYAASTYFGEALVSNGWYCVYNGDGNSTTVNNLMSGYSYKIFVVEYNGLGGNQKYNVSPVPTNPLVASTALVTPDEPVSRMHIRRVSNTQLVFEVNAEEGDKRAVFIREGAIATASPVDNTTYTAQTGFGAGSQIGNTGWYCIYNGVGDVSVEISGLSPNKTYTLHVVDYNGPAGSERYNVGSNSQNPVSFTTLPNPPGITYAFAASSGSFTPLSAGTALDVLEEENRLSENIPLGFTFLFSGIPYSSVRASSNGFLSFNPYVENVPFLDDNNLAGSDARALIAPLWDYLDGFGGQASYNTSGVSPNRIFTIEYLNWRWTAFANAGISFQVKLYETSNKIEFVYRQEAGALFAAAASIGLAFPNKGTGNFVSLNGSGVSPTASTTVATGNISAKPATGQVYTFTPVKLNQTIVFNNLADKFYGDADFNLTATATSGLPVTYASSNTSVATISGSTVTLVGVGSVTITASQAGDQNYNAAAPVEKSFIVNKGNQNITFLEMSVKKYGSGTFDLTGTASSGLPLTYSSSNANVATISGSTVTITGVGTTEITAVQAGTAQYNAATNVVRTFTVIKGDQTITFDPIEGEKRYEDEPFTVSATANTALPVTFSSSNLNVATIDGNTVTIVGAGGVTITASQAGNDFYNPATTTRSITILKANQTITFDEIGKVAEGDTYTLSATTTSELPIVFVTYNDNSPQAGEITIEGNKLTAIKAGLVSVEAKQDGDNNYFNRSAGQSICILPAKPQITVSDLDTETPLLSGPDESHYYYEWYKDGQLFATNQDHTLEAQQAGVYKLVVGTGQCKSDPSNEITLVVTGNEVSLSKVVTVFPNPAAETVTVDATNLQSSGPVTVSILDVLGRKLQTTSGSGKMEFNVKNYYAGTYIVKVEGGKRQVVKQFIKK